MAFVLDKVFVKPVLVVVHSFNIMANQIIVPVEGIMDYFFDPVNDIVLVIGQVVLPIVSKDGN